MGFDPYIKLTQENFAHFGDWNENFPSAALNDIAGGAAVTTESLRVAPDVRGKEIGSSLVRKPGAGEMYADPLYGVQQYFYIWHNRAFCQGKESENPMA